VRPFIRRGLLNLLASSKKTLSTAMRTQPNQQTRPAQPWPKWLAFREMRTSRAVPSLNHLGLPTNPLGENQSLSSTACHNNTTAQLYTSTALAQATAIPTPLIFTTRSPLPHSRTPLTCPRHPAPATRGFAPRLPRSGDRPLMSCPAKRRRARRMRHDQLYRHVVHSGSATANGS
jgi:hypothetical protein